MITFLNVFAQKPETSQITITGVIIDSNTKEPLEYATVILKDAKTKQLSGGITDSKGSFSIKTNPGTYDVSFEFISFKTITMPSSVKFMANFNILIEVGDFSKISCAHS